MTIPRLWRSWMRIEGQDRFRTEVLEVLRVGLGGAAWVTVDDTGARQNTRNGFCTQIGNDRYAWFGTTGPKRRLNFLELLRAGHGDLSSTPRRSPT